MYRFDTFGGEKNENGTGRDGKNMEIIIAWRGRDGTMGVNFRDGTGRYSTMNFRFMTGRDGKYKLSRRHGKVRKHCHDGTGR